VQLDNTRIAVRERGLIETLDLTLHVIRSFAPRLIPALLLGIVPFALINQLVIGWMWEPPIIDWNDPGEGFLAVVMVVLMQSLTITRFTWAYTLLVFFQAPAATVFAESYLGGAVFKHDKTLWESVKDVLSMWGPRPAPGAPREAGPLIPFFICQLVMRGTLLATVLPLFIYNGEFNIVIEVLVPLAMFVVVAGLRAFRPFINEIIVLEKNPLWSKTATMTVGRRSSFLHNNSAGELFGQWFASCIVAFVLMHLVFWSMWMVYWVMFGDYDLTGWVPQLVLRPIALWTVVAFMGIARFLSYLDLRIRQEGWEVELLIRAESARLAEKLV